VMNKRSVFKPAKNKNASGLHKTVLKVAQEAFPGNTILEEQTIDVQIDHRTQKLPVDIVIKDLKIAIEVHGQQHYEFCTHFHGTLDGFKAQKARDRAKTDAIYAAGWSQVIVKFDEVERLTVKKFLKLVSRAIEEQQ
jgi:hypothetical protein